MRFVLILGIFIILKVYLSVEASADSSVKTKIIKLKVREQTKHDSKQGMLSKVNAWSFSPRKFRLNKEYLKHLTNKKGRKMEAQLKWFQFHNISNLIKTLL
jgi:hypothetical protein